MNVSQLLGHRERMRNAAWAGPNSAYHEVAALSVFCLRNVQANWPAGNSSLKHPFNVAVATQTLASASLSQRPNPGDSILKVHVHLHAM